MKKYLIVLLILFTRISFSQSLGSESGLKVKGLNLGQSGLSVKKVTATGTAASYDADAQAYFDTVTIRGGTITTARKDTINLFVEMLKDSLALTNLRDGFDRIWLLAAQDTVSALTSLVNPSSTKAISIVDPTFTINMGFTGNASNMYINTRYDLNTGTAFTQNSSSIGVYSNSSAGGSYNELGGRASSDKTAEININGTTGALVTAMFSNEEYGTPADFTGNVGLFTVSRTNSANYDTYKNGVNVRTQTVASGAFGGSVELFLLARSNVGSPVLHSSRQISFAYAGKGLTTAEMLKLWHCVQWYLNTLGFGI